jgi:hypothetical protein
MKPKAEPLDPRALQPIRASAPTAVEQSPPNEGRQLRHSMKAEKDLCGTEREVTGGFHQRALGMSG